MSESPSVPDQGSGAALSPGQRQYPCQSCGARLVFAAGTTALQCPYCGFQQEIAAEAERSVREHSYDDWVNSADKPTGHVGAYAVRCSGCGAQTETDKLSDACPFCGAAIVVEEHPAEMITPEAVLPFAIPQAKALNSFRDWIGSRWFAPNSLKALAAHDKIQGTYLPHWTYDSQTTTQYSGERGDHYYETETYRDDDGNQQTRQVQRTAWRHASGVVDRAFDDVLVTAVTSLPEKRLNDLEPWDLPAATPYQPEYLAGFQTLRYQVEPPEGLEKFKTAVQPQIRDDCRRDIGGDEQRVHQMNTQFSALTFKLLLLPVWLAAYQYQNRTWQVMINARTGEVIGERPYSAWKIAALVIAILLLIVVVVVIVSLTRHHPATVSG